MVELKKIFFTYGKTIREGFETFHPSQIHQFMDDSVEEVQAEDILDKVPDLKLFIEECYRILPIEKKAIFTNQYFASSGAWRSPLSIRGISEQSLNFANRKWREESKFTEFETKLNFEVQGSFALEQDVVNRFEEARQFWMRRYINVAQAVLFTLIKKGVDE
jgi:hypothetical protein